MFQRFSQIFQLEESQIQISNLNMKNWNFSKKNHRIFYIPIGCNLAVEYFKNIHYIRFVIDICVNGSGGFASAGAGLSAT